jgi:hypothetical protein
MSFEQCTWSLGVRYGLTFEQRSVLFILGHSLRHLYEPVMRADYDDRISAALAELAARRGEKH